VGSPGKMHQVQTATVLRDGTPLCADFQVRACKTKGMRCQNGEHRCAIVRASGRVCGDPKHAAADHR